MDRAGPPYGRSWSYPVSPESPPKPLLFVTWTSHWGRAELLLAWTLLILVGGIALNSSSFVSPGRANVLAWLGRSCGHLVAGDARPTAVLTERCLVCGWLLRRVPGVGGDRVRLVGSGPALSCASAQCQRRRRRRRRRWDRGPFALSLWRVHVCLYAWTCNEMDRKRQSGCISLVMGCLLRRGKCTLLEAARKGEAKPRQGPRGQILGGGAPRDWSVGSTRPVAPAWANGDGLEEWHSTKVLAPMPIRGMRCAWLLFSRYASAASVSQCPAATGKSDSYSNSSC